MPRSAVRISVAKSVLAVVLIASFAGRGRGRPGGKRAVRSRSATHGLHGAEARSIPKNLYELLGLELDADAASIRKAYHSKLKVCHPDRSGPEAQDICAFLNRAYEVLSDPDQKAQYDQQLLASGCLNKTLDVEPDLDGDGAMSPQWNLEPRQPRTKEPAWTGHPLSRSLWERVPFEDRGDMWEARRFLFVDEFHCISCWNCVSCAPKSICIDAEHGRARVFAQWGNSEDDLEWARISCPVDCISWVSRKELQTLEHVSAQKIYHDGVRQTNIFLEAKKWECEKSLSDRKRNKSGMNSVLILQDELWKVVSRLTEPLRQAGGW
eukprot:TRINITY_DN24584_c0_g1_i1.p1 TRINITY_DN24584_c0_g1~~TRINITY_DN24584_c0_g1_i1.p1  ORF type:complete len:369 (+),score=36.75 TRINITY_DN24584_c0_g1_i1:140-1108(+)